MLFLITIDLCVLISRVNSIKVDKDLISKISLSQQIHPLKLPPLCFCAPCTQLLTFKIKTKDSTSTLLWPQKYPTKSSSFLLGHLSLVHSDQDYELLRNNLLLPHYISGLKNALLLMFPHRIQVPFDQ